MTFAERILENSIKWDCTKGNKERYCPPLVRVKSILCNNTTINMAHPNYWVLYDDNEPLLYIDRS